MNPMRKFLGFWLVPTICLVLPLLSLGVAGCSDDDDDDDDEAAATNATTVVTNTVTNTVVVTNPPTTTIAAVAGTWNGAKNDATGSYTFAVTLDQENDAVTGNFTGTKTGSVSVAGTVNGGLTDGNHLVLVFIYTAGAAGGYFETWDGTVNANGTSYVGTYTPGNGATQNTFALQR